jgi:hypothetical protein
LPSYSAGIHFERLDYGQKGYLDAHDLFRFMESYNSAMTYARSERVLRRIDFDNDGRVSFAEWHNFIKPFVHYLGGERRSHSPARLSISSNS